MSETDAQSIANQVMAKLLEHPETLGHRPLASESLATQAAKNLVQFRKTLIEELKKQS